MQCKASAAFGAVLAVGLCLTGAAANAQARDPGAPPPSQGPQGSSQHAPGEDRYDEVGYAGVRDVAGGGPSAGQAVIAVHPSLAAGTIVEVTSLDSGRNILVLVTAQMAVPGGRILDLSPGAARALGMTGTAGPVRVRKVAATPQDASALQAGRAASERLDAPQGLLTALRRHLPAAPRVDTAPAQPPPVRPSNPAAPPRARPAGTMAQGRYFVQVAALSAAPRAQALASSLGGSVRSGGGLYRVQLGPFADLASAERARAGVVRQGYGDARIVTND